MPEPYFSIIYITRNRKYDLLESIRSVLFQETGDYEVVVVDQGSTDGTSTLLKREYACIKLITLPRNIGVPAGRNLGARNAIGQYLVFIDDDTILRQDALKNLRMILEHHPELGVIGFRILKYGTNEIANWCYPKGMKRYANSPFETMSIVGCGHAINRELFLLVGGYDEELFFWGEELSLIFKIISISNCKVIYLPHVVVWHKLSPINRIKWERGRLYFKVRSRLLLIWWYYPDILSKILSSVYYLLGYTARAIFYKSPMQVVRGVLDAYRMFRKTFQNKTPLPRTKFVRYKSILWRQRLAILYGRSLVVSDLLK